MKKHIAPAFLLLIFFIAYMTLYRHVVIFHEQHHLFRFSIEYIRETAHQHGVLALCSAFLAQFAYYPWLAALIWSAMLVGVYCMTRSILRRIVGFNDSLQLSAIVPCWAFYTSVNIDGSLNQFVIVFSSALALYLISLLLPARKRVISIPWKPMPYLAPVIIAAFFGAFYFYSFRPVTITLPDGRTRSFTREEVKNQRFNEELMVKAAQAVRRADWDEVIAISDRQAETGVKNHLMLYFRAMALYHRGELLDRLFEQPQAHGPNSLFFPWKADKNRAEYGGYIFEQLGALNSAIHWEFEALVGWGETAYHLINLSRYYIETQRPKQAEKFIHPLKQTLFYRGEARRLEEQKKAGHVPGLRDALAGVKQDPANFDPIRFDNVLNIGADCKYILLNDPTNEMARDYMMLIFLLANNVGIFYDNLCQFYRPDEPLPRIFEEALCLVRLNYGSERLAADGFQISPQVDAAYRAFLAEKQKGRFANFSPEQRKSLWYYYTFVSPSGNTINF